MNVAARKIHIALGEAVGVEKNYKIYNRKVWVYALQSLTSEFTEHISRIFRLTYLTYTTCALS